MLIILAVVTTSATLEATGALNLIVRMAEKVLRKNPKYVVFLAPVSTFALTMLVGTGHACYPLLPVIYDVSYRQGIRPERPMAISSVAAQMGITASPIAAAAAAVIGVSAKAGIHIGLIEILRVTIPAGVIGMLLAALWSMNRGKDLNKDPEYLAKMQDPEMRKFIEGEMATTLNDKVSKEAKTSLTVFIAAIVAIVLLAIFPNLLPLDNGKPISMSIVIQFVIFAAGAVILFLTKVKPKSISDSKVFNAGMIAVIMIFGIAWMSDTVIEGNKPYIISLISAMVKAHPWTFAMAMFFFSAFLKSQAATLIVMLPLGFALGVPVPVIIGCIPASYAYFFFCFYPSDLAAINFDRTGTTHIGKYILNHSFMIPGLIGVISATIIAYFLSVYIY
jgi:anaerobic C4-dicarboxylate transporter DcuB